jgi:hypothetical protein
MISPDRLACPDDKALTNLNVTVDADDLQSIDDAVGRFHQLQDREDFIFWAIQYAIETVREEAEGHNNDR